MAFLITSLGTIIVATFGWLAVEHKLRERRAVFGGSRAIEVAVFLGVFGVVVPAVFYLGLPERLAGMLEYLARSRVEPPEAKIAASATGTVEERPGETRYLVRLKSDEERRDGRTSPRRQALAVWKEEPAGFRGGREELVRHSVSLRRGQRSDLLRYQPPPWRPGEKDGFRRRWELRTKSRTPFHSYVNQEGTPTRAVGRSGEGRDPPEALEIEILLSDAAEDSPVEVEFVYWRERRAAAGALADSPVDAEAEPSQPADVKASPAPVVTPPPPAVVKTDAVVVTITPVTTKIIPYRHDRVVMKIGEFADAQRMQVSWGGRVWDDVVPEFLDGQWSAVLLFDTADNPRHQPLLVRVKSGADVPVTLVKD